ncbi:Alpha/beta hydrolase family-domain-containing protein [Aspergillus cavernicola]|uniref:Alpha/beta hydrolase family-domain-containing protein n=1 Tax=Aspergillus cavernicola TaxID=176166 RepID=A0ABR4IRF0_9EURO
MASLLFLTTLSILSQVSKAVPTRNTTRPCVNLNLSLPVTANNSIYDIPRVDNSIDAVDYAWDLDRWTAPNPADRVTGVKDVHETFTISAQLCVPQHSEKAEILQIATHGFGFDKRYWDSEVHPEQYSYVDAALAAGYSILTYDRLGTGHSDKPDAYEIVQVPVEVEILKELILLARSGTLAGESRSPSGIIQVPEFEKTVLVGHSFGSGLTIAVLAGYPDIVDGAVSTGLIPNAEFGAAGQRSFGLEYAPVSEPRRFGDRGSGYLVQGTESSVQQIFFKKGFFESEMLAYAEQIKETGTAGEFVSFATALGRPAALYSGPILFALGQYDFGTCLGECPGTYDLAALKNETFPGAADVSVHVQPGSGHALTMHSNATGHYEAIFAYLGEHGL